VEEEYWRQRGRQQWFLKGDANTKFFHAIANGRRRKCAILALNLGEGLTTDKLAIQGIIYAFYRELMGTEEPKRLALDPNFWPSHSRVIDQENVELMRSFTMDELEAVLRETKTNTVPGPDGFPVFSTKDAGPCSNTLCCRF
jgi:mannosylglycoprotein endo-beta-mannosidase